MKMVKIDGCVLVILTIITLIKYCLSIADEEKLECNMGGRNTVRNKK